MTGDEAAADEIESSELTDHLSIFSEDLDSRWRGALFSLNPRNPAAARHFCTSAREIITRIIDISAPDDVVDSDIDDVVGLFRVFNDGTHGDAGTFDLVTLQALRGRVEGAIRFLSTVARP